MYIYLYILLDGKKNAAIRKKRTKFIQTHKYVRYQKTLVKVCKKFLYFYKLTWFKSSAT